MGSLKYLYELKQPVPILFLQDDESVIPILTIRLELIDNRVAFRPPLDQNTSVISVQELVLQWLDGFLARGRLVKMLGPKVGLCLKC